MALASNNAHDITAYLFLPLPEECHHDKGLVGIPHTGLAQEGGPEKRPEGHQEMSAADAAQIEGEIRPGSHEEDP